MVEDSQVPEGGPPLVIKETYGAWADNEHDDNESADEESQETQFSGAAGM